MDKHEIDAMAYEDKANKLDQETRERITKAIDAIDGVWSVSSSSNELVYLFKIFNKNINPTPTDRNCNGCVNTVVGFWKAMINRWQKNR